MKKLLLIVATLLVLAVSGCAPQVDVEADAAAVRSVFDEATAALNPGGADIVDLDAEDAVIMYANELAVIGKEAIRAREQRFDDQATFEETRSVEEVVVSGDWAFVRWTGTGTVTPKDGGESSEFNRKGITIFQRQPDNSWKIARVIWNSNLTGVVQAQSGLEGEWRIEEVTIVGGANEGTYSNPQPSLFIFTGRHYSTLLIPGDSPRQQFPDQTTDEEKLAAFDNFIANAGTYQVTGSTLTVQPFVAKVPNAMVGDGFAYEYSLDGNSLTLVLAGAAWASSDTEITYRLNRLE